MKRILSIFLLLPFFLSAQESNVTATTASNFSISPPLKDILEPVYPTVKPKVVKNKMRRHKHVNKDALPYGNDVIWQKEAGQRVNRAPDVNFDGVNSSAFPPDPSGAVGPNHYVQMTNSGYRVYDKTGTPLISTSSLASLWPGSSNEGDPIVMYDKYADRWFLSQFQSSPNSILVAISMTPDPLGQYYTYEFDWNGFPDYPKYSIWHDGYYMTANVWNQNVAAFERDKMIAGDASAQVVQMDIPGMATGGFNSPLPADADGELPPAGTPMNIFYFQDDSWGGVGADAIKIWEMNVNWDNPNSSTISVAQTLNVTPFDSEFTASWDDIEQPGTSQNIDAVPGALMYRVQYRKWDDYNTVVMNHTVDVNGANQGGVRWYELRENAGAWSVYQEGTYSPDGESRFMGSISMDYQGNIGLAYCVSSNDVYPSIWYTGRLAADPLGTMTLAEEVIIDGTGSQSGVNRYGDYSHMCVDPDDDATFWFTGEYMGTSSSRTRIASFKIANDLSADVGPTDVTAPVDGVLTAAETVVINITNFGVMDQSAFPVEYRVDGGAWVTENFVGTVVSGTTESHTFATPADLSAPGNHTIEIRTGLTIDMATANDVYSENVLHQNAYDVGAISIDGPNSALNMSDAEYIQVTIESFGVLPVGNFPISYTVNGGAPVTETVVSTIAPGASLPFTFSTPADMSAPGFYTINVYTGLLTDYDNGNNDYSEQIEHEQCLPEGNCTFGDGFVNVTLNTIDNDSDCGLNGYSDFTSMETDLDAGSEYNLEVSSTSDLQYLSVWVDWNDDLFYTPSELLVTNFEFGYTGMVPVYIPINAPAGEHIFRVKSCYDQESDEACLDCVYGETEDYTINVKSTTGIEDVNVENVWVSTNGNTLAIHVEGLNESVEMVLYNTVGQKVFESALEPAETAIYSVDMKHYARGYYMIKLQGKTAHSLQRVVY